LSTPTGDNAFLRELERNVEAELTQVETSQPERELADTPIDEWLFDPADAQREEVGLRSLLGAVEAMEHGSRTGPPPPAHGSHVAARDHCLSLVRAVDRPTGAARYGRMFPGLDPLATDPQLLMRGRGPWPPP
jgi:hypothetical protein